MAKQLTLEQTDAFIKEQKIYANEKVRNASGSYDTGLCIFSWSADNLAINEEIEAYCESRGWQKLY